MFHGMKYIYAVYQEMSFSKAAKSLYISQPSLSAAVRKEEEEMGYPIFDRSTNPIQLTQFGQEYIRAAEKIMEVEENFSQYINDISGLKVGSLTIGCNTLFTSYLLPSLLAEFNARYPAVSIHLVEGTTAYLTELLMNGKLDLVVENTLLDPEIFDQKFYCYDRIMLTVPRSFPINRQIKKYAFTSQQIQEGEHLYPDVPPVPLELFRDQPFLLLKTGNDSRVRADAVCAAHGFTPSPRLELEQQFTAYNLACCNLGSCFCGDLLIRHVPPRYEVLFYKLDEDISVRSISFFYKRSRYQSRPVQEFLRMLDRGETGRV